MRSLLPAVLLLSSATAYAQLKLPDASPAATTEQTIGITDIKVVYHRPGVNGRAIWGELVPYNDVWRTGADENTLVSFSSDVKIAGKPLHAGTYGLHAIPTTKDWTIIFSNATTSWGSFSYDQKEDALRVTVTPRAEANNEERLLYRFDDLGDSKGTLVLRWEKIAVPIAIEIETPKVVMASIRNELRGQAGYRDTNLTTAARYWLRNGGDLEEALKLADRAIEAGGQYPAHMIKAQILDKKGDAKLAAAERTKAEPLATANDLVRVGYGQFNEKKYDDAIKTLTGATKRFPDSVNAYSVLGNALAAKGDKPGATAAYNKALALAKDPGQKKDIQADLAKLK